MNIKGAISIAVLGVGTIIGLTILGGSWYTVAETERGVITRYGEAIGTADTGLHFKLPIIDSVHFDHVTEQTYDFQFATYSRDQQPTQLSGSVTYQMLPASIAEVYTTFGGLENAVATRLSTQLPRKTKEVFGQYSAKEIVQNRAQVGVDVEESLRGVLTDYGIIIKAVNFEDVEFSTAYENMVEQRMLAEVEVEKREQELAREKVQKQITITKAQAEAQRVREQAQAQADATRLQGEATADAIKARAEALSNNPLLIELTKAERWDGKLPTTMLPGQSVPFVNAK